jgi:outer membrane protein W
MRTTVVIALLLLVLPAAAQQNAVNVFISDLSVTSSDHSGDDVNGGIGIAYQRRFAPEWAAELSIAYESHDESYRVFDHNGNGIDRGGRSWHTTPVDLSGFYLFQNQTNWKPYVGLGVRWVDAPSDAADDTNFLYGATGGVTWEVGKKVGLRFDGKLLFGDRPTWVDTFTGSVGLAWRF